MTASKLSEAIIQRRSHRLITNKSPLSTAEIEDLIRFSLTHSPSSSNSQSSRAILLTEEAQSWFWQIAISNARKVQTGDHLSATVKRFQGFQNGYGTVLIYEDYSVAPSMAEEYRNHSNAMLQFVIWTALADAGLGASLQHVQAFTGKETCEKYNLPSSWKLIAQLPFGAVDSSVLLPEKTRVPIEQRFLSFV
ncbi:nitroreductase [Obelidium mucronatum]|nr:nitroreductase [Obelidium mucronatum]